MKGKLFKGENLYMCIFVNWLNHIQLFFHKNNDLIKFSQRLFDVEFYVLLLPCCNTIIFSANKIIFEANNKETG